MRANNKRLNIHCIGSNGRLLALSLLLFAIGLVAGRANTVLWSEGFEGYNYEASQTFGNLDKNASGANAAANGVGNPWFGPNPLPGNAWVTAEMQNPNPPQDTITPHSGTNMIRGGQDGSGGWYSGWDNDIDHVNLAYRFHGGAPLKANFSIDWWFYDTLGTTYLGDPDAGPDNFGDHAGIEYSTLAPTDTDYVNGCFIGTPGEDEATGPTDDSYAVTARLAIGAYEYTGDYETNVYQVQILNASDGFAGQDTTYEWGAGWFNTTFVRTNGWRHAAITVDANNMAVFSIDGTVVLKHATGATNGFNVFTTTELQDTPGTYNQSAYYDDITLGLINPPEISSTTVNGSDVTFGATDGQLGWTYDVVMSTDLTQPLSAWTSVGTTTLSTNGSFSITAAGALTPAESKRFFALKGRIVP
jgi:hypothetical protein